MNTRQLAEQWLSQHYPRFAGDAMRASKFYPEKPGTPHDLWYFTFPVNFFHLQGHVNLLLQKEENSMDFHFLRVPYAFFVQNRENLDIRSSGDEFDLHISARPQNRFTDTRGGGVNFAEFLLQ